jgi:hypothetical protein
MWMDGDGITGQGPDPLESLVLPVLMSLGEQSSGRCRCDGDVPGPAVPFETVSRPCKSLVALCLPVHDSRPARAEECRKALTSLAYGSYSFDVGLLDALTAKNACK